MSCSFVESRVNFLNFAFFISVDPASTTTELTSRNDLKTPSVSVLSTTSSNTIQLLMVFGGILGGLVIVFMVFVLICYLKQRSLSDRTNEGTMHFKNTAPLAFFL